MITPANRITKRQRIALSFDKAHNTYDEACVLQEAIAQELLSRLSLLKISPSVIVDLGSGTGKVTQYVAKGYPNAFLLGVDLAFLPIKKALKRQYDVDTAFVQADAMQLPLADNSVDFIFSNATIQWCDDLFVLFNEIQRVLTPGGLLMFTTFGPDTLIELRRSWQQVNCATHVNVFKDMHDIGDVLAKNQFINPVMDVEKYTLTYASVLDLLRDLRAIGSCVVDNQQARFTNRRDLQQLQVAYEHYRKQGDLPATYEVIYGHAFKKEFEQQDLPRRRPQRISVDQILAYKEKQRGK